VVSLSAVILFSCDLIIVTNKIDPDLSRGWAFIFGVFFALILMSVSIATGEVFAQARIPFSELDQEKII